MRSRSDKWERLRKLDPTLQLVPLEGDLEWFFGGEPDADISVDFFILCSEESNAPEAGLYLLTFLKDHPFTFMNSGWVKSVIGRIALEDEAVTKEFLKTYWRKGRTAASRTRAYRALEWVRGVHRLHWLKAQSWMQHFHKRPHSLREKESLRIDRALEKYLEREDCVRCKCLPDKYLKTIAATGLEQPNAPRSIVTDDALARCFGTSSSTLIHVRASIGKFKKKQRTI
jgi:hypothetical protein